MIEQIECKKCSLHYVFNDNSTPDLCPICFSGMTLDLPKVGEVDYRGYTK